MYPNMNPEHVQTRHAAQDCATLARTPTPNVNSKFCRAMPQHWLLRGTSQRTHERHASVCSACSPHVQVADLTRKKRMAMQTVSGSACAARQALQCGVEHA